MKVILLALPALLLASPTWAQAQPFRIPRPASALAATASRAGSACPRRQTARPPSRSQQVLAARQDGGKAARPAKGCTWPRDHFCRSTIAPR